MSAPARILLVEDDEDMRQFLEMTLVKEGFQVNAVVSGTDALKCVEESVPNLIIMDLMMPGLGGYETIRQLQSGAAASVPIVVVTGRFSDPSTEDMIRQEPNVVEFMEKPINPSKFGLKLRTILGEGGDAAAGSS